MYIQAILHSLNFDRWELYEKKTTKVQSYSEEAKQKLLYLK